MCFKFYNENIVVEKYYIKGKEFNESIKLDYIYDNYYNIKNNIELSKEDEKKLYNLVNNLEYGINNTNCIVTPKYYIKYQDNELYLDEDCGLAIYNNEEVSVTKGRKEIKDFLDSIINSIENVYLYKLEDNSYLEIDNIDKNNLKNSWNNMTKEEVYDIDFNSNYLLIIDNQEIYVDTINNICLYDNKLIKIDVNINNGCCSCCDNLKLGESCIDMCCPCK